MLASKCHKYIYIISYFLFYAVLVGIFYHNCSRESQKNSPLACNVDSYRKKKLPRRELNPGLVRTKS